MALERWYPTVTGLADGEMLITEDGPDTPEVGQRDGTMRSLTTAVLDLPLYPWLDVAPDGRALYSGPDQTMRKINPSGTGAWQSYTRRDGINRTYGGHALFDIGKVLVAGGGASANDSRVTDISGNPPTVSQNASIAFGRRQNNLTLLADGTALATGDNSSGAESSASTTASTTPSCGTRRPDTGRRSRHSRQPANATRPRCRCPTGACSPPAADSAVRQQGRQRV